MKILFFCLLASSCALGQVSISGSSITMSGGVTIQTQAPPSVPPIVVTTTSVPNATQNAPYSTTLTATGGIPCTGTPYSWAITSGALPSPMTLSAAGVISGTTSSTGTFNFSVAASDCSSDVSAPQALTLIVNAAPAPGVSENQYLTGNADGVCTYPGGVTVDGKATLPQQCMCTSLLCTPSPGTTTTVTSNSAMTAALAALTCGQTIKMAAANGPYQGFQLPGLNCPVNNTITIETDQTAAGGFPPEHTQITPCASNQASVADYPNYPCSSPAQLTAQITCTGTSDCITAASGANGYRFIGLDVFCNPSSGIINNCVNFSGSTGTHFILDRTMVHGPAYACTGPGANGLMTCPSTDVQHGVIFGSTGYGAFINGQVYNIGTAGTTSDATGIGWGGNGCTAGAEDVKKAYNSLLSATGEAWLAGGSGCGANTVTPNDLEIRAVHVFKPVKWLQCNGGSGKGCNTGHPVLKNNGELKNWNRALIEDSVCENSWDGWQTDQAGFCWLLTPKNQSNASFITASSDSTGTILSGAFPSTMASPNCAPGGCHVVINGLTTQVQSWTAGTPNTVTVSPAVTPNLANVSTKIFQPGLNPNATVTNVTFRWDRIMNVHNGIQLGSGVSDGGDISKGANSVEIHDVQMEGINYLAGNGINPGTGEEGIEEFSGQKSPNQLHDWGFEHNTVAAYIPGANFSFTALDYALDGSDTTGAGTGNMTGRVVRNNIGVGGGLTAYNQGGLYPNGANNGLTKQAGTNFIYTENVVGTGLWTKQFTGIPFPASNADPGDNPPGNGCGTGSATCHPSGTAFTSLFQSYNGPSGQPGYLGNYQLVCPGPYCSAGTDGLPLGVSNYTTWTNNLQGVWSPTTYTAANITQAATLPTAVFGQNYSQALAATSASPAQNWLVISGSLPPGISLNPTCIPGGWALCGSPSATGTYSFQVQMVDGAQQYAQKTFSLTVNGSGPSTTASWAIAFTNPSGCAQPDYFDILQSTNEWYLACRDGGFYKSTNQGSNWTNITSGISICTGGCGAWTLQVNPNDNSLIAVVGGVIGGTGVTMWRSSNDGSNWTQLTPTNYHNTQAGADSGCAMPPAAGGNLVCGGWFGSNNQSEWYSTNNGPNATLGSFSPAVSSVLGLGRNPVDSTYWIGTENGGFFCSSNGGQTGSNVMAYTVGPPTNGDDYFFAYDSSGDVFVSTQGGIWKGVGSNCGSYTFTNLFTNTSQGRGILIDSLGSIYYGHKSNNSFKSSLYRSTNGGTNFSAWDQCPACAGGILPQQLEMWKMIENTTDHKVYGVLENGSTNAANVYSTSK